MAYRITHVAGNMEADYPKERFGELLDELRSAEAEHPDVAVAHESEWSLSIGRNGIVVFENLEEGEPLYLGPLSRAQIIVLMVAIAEGRIDTVQSEPWTQMYPDVSAEDSKP